LSQSGAGGAYFNFDVWVTSSGLHTTINNCVLNATWRDDNTSTPPCKACVLEIYHTTDAPYSGVYRPTLQCLSYKLINSTLLRSYQTAPPLCTCPTTYPSTATPQIVVADWALYAGTPGTNPNGGGGGGGGSGVASTLLATSSLIIAVLSFLATF
jgi:hypothetical protein